MKTIVITGSSSGIGNTASLLFLSRGWRVIGISRTKADITHENYKGYEVDVTDYPQVDSVLEEVFKNEKVNCLFSNAGYGYFSPVENSDLVEIKKQFEVNVFSHMYMIKKFLPVMRLSKEGGTIIVTSSLSGRVSTPFFSFYSGSKFALEGFLESLNFELQDTNIKLRIIEPGIIKTNFFSSDIVPTDFGDGFYKSRFEKFMNGFLNRGTTALGPEAVAELVWKVSNTHSKKLRYLITGRAYLLSLLHFVLPVTWYQALLSWYLK